MKAQETDEADGDPMYENMSEEEFTGFLAEALRWFAGTEDTPPARVDDFRDAGIVTTSSGFVAKIGSATFHVTIVRAA